MVVEELLVGGVGVVGMVGDGINDVLVFVCVDIGFVMGVMGIDMVIEMVDVVLMDDDLCKIFVFVWLLCVMYCVLV